MEKEVRALTERLFSHVAAFPWTDPGWVGKAREAAAEQIIDATTRDILQTFNKEQSKWQKNGPKKSEKPSVKK